MRTEYSKTLTRALAGVALALTLFVSADTAQADFLDDVIYAIDTSHALDFPLAPWREAYNACKDDSNLVNCVNQYKHAAEKNGDHGDQVIRIFHDIENSDYTQLIADSSEAVACAAAKLLTGIPVCDILGALYDGAKAIYDWFAGLFGGNSYTPNIGETSAYPCSAGQRLMQNGQCSYCPLGQALVGPSDISKVDPKDFTKLDSNYNTCGFCPGPTENATQSDDKRCWTKLVTDHQTPNSDGSACSGGEHSVGPVCCPAGAVSPSSGVCAPACNPGQVWDDNSNSCKSCGDGATAQYDKPGHGSAGKCMCDPFGATVMDQSGNCVTACLVGSVKNANGTCVPVCQSGQVYDKDVKYCHACGEGTVPYFYNGPTSSAGTCGTCYNGGVPEGGKCVCPPGDQAVPPRGVCQQCPANTFSLTENSATCTPCADNQVSDPGSHNCHTLSCGAGMHAVNHKCVSISIIHLLPSTRPPQNR